jgi:hypothetical protein
MSTSLRATSSDTYSIRARCDGPGVAEIAWMVHGGDRSTLNRHIESWQPAEDFVVVGSVFENPEPRGS